MTAPDPRVGELLDRRYRLLRRLGAGGAGAVYLARHEEMDRLVAVKLLHSDLFPNPAVVEFILQYGQQAMDALPEADEQVQQVIAEMILAGLLERGEDGSLKLTGVEYVVAGGSQPTLFGQTLVDTNLGRFGQPDTNVWTLHAWIWKPNPTPVTGIFSPWNPRVTCT